MYVRVMEEWKKKKKKKDMKSLFPIWEKEYNWFAET